MLFEVLRLRWLHGSDPVYGLLFTFAATLVVVNVMRFLAGPMGSPYSIPDALSGATNLGFTLYPTYKLFVIVVSRARLRARVVVHRAQFARRAHPGRDRESRCSFARSASTRRRLVTLTFGAGRRDRGACRRARRADD